MEKKKKTMIKKEKIKNIVSLQIERSSTLRNRFYLQFISVTLTSAASHDHFANQIQNSFSFAIFHRRPRSIRWYT